MQKMQKHVLNEKMIKNAKKCFKWKNDKKWEKMIKNVKKMIKKWLKT